MSLLLSVVVSVALRVISVFLNVDHENSVKFNGDLIIVRCFLFKLFIIQSNVVIIYLNISGIYDKSVVSEVSQLPAKDTVVEEKIPDGCVIEGKGADAYIVDNGILPKPSGVPGMCGSLLTIASFVWFV